MADEAKAGAGTTETGTTVATGAAVPGGEAKKPDAAAAAVGADGKAADGSAAKPADGSQAAAAAKPADDAAGKAKPAEAGADGKPAAEKPKAPDTYTLKLPAGGSLDDADLKYVETMARAAGLSNDDAQRVLDEQASRVAETSQAYLAATVADKDYGGEKLPETQQAARAVIARIRPEGHPRRDAFLRLLNRGGVGNHVEVLGFLADLGKMMREDQPGAMGAGGAGEQSAERVLYPSMKQ